MDPPVGHPHLADIGTPGVVDDLLQDLFRRIGPIEAQIGVGHAARMQRRSEKRAIGRNLRDRHEPDDDRARDDVSMNLNRFRAPFRRACVTHAHQFIAATVAARAAYTANIVWEFVAKKCARLRHATRLTLLKCLIGSKRTPINKTG